MRQSMAYDVNRTGERGPVVRDERYLKNPRKFDFPGVDTGDMKKRKPTGAALAAKRKSAARRRSRRSRSASKRRSSSKSRSASKRRSRK